MYCCSYSNEIVSIKKRCHIVCKMCQYSVFLDQLKTFCGQIDQMKSATGQNLNNDVSIQLLSFNQTNKKMSVTSTLFKYDYQFKTFSKSFCGVVQFLLKTGETKTKTFQGHQCQYLISTSTGFIKVRETSLTFRTISIYDKDVLVNLYSSLNSNQSEMYCCSYCNVIV